jgi:Ni/Co efflux regulator RcnB
MRLRRWYGRLAALAAITLLCSLAVPSAYSQEEKKHEEQKHEQHATDDRRIDHRERNQKDERENDFLHG